MHRLLVVTTVPSTLNAFLTPFAEHFRGDGWRVDAMAADATASPARSSFDRMWDVEWSRNPLDPRNLRTAAPRVEQIVAEEGYDIVHVHTPVAAFVTRYALRRLRETRDVRVVYTAHGFHFAPGLGSLRNAAFLNLERTAGRWTDELIVINADDLAAARKRHLVPEDHLHLIHGIGVDTEYYAPEAVSEDAARRVLEELGIGDEALLLMVAEFTANKRHADVVRAFARTDGTSHLAFAGEGPMLSETRSLCEQLGLDDRVHFLGFRDDVRELLAASRATVLFSGREGLPRSSMESLSMATPVIGADIRGVRDLLSGGCGTLVPPGDIDALAAAMTGLTSDRLGAAAMGRRGREKMRGEYSLPAVIAEHEQLYEGILKERAVT